MGNVQAHVVPVPDAYTVHLGVVDCLTRPEFGVLWSREFGASDDDVALIPVIYDLYEQIRSAYCAFGAPTDTLVTKVLLGALGCFPAMDTYFDAGYKHCGFSMPPRLNSAMIRDVLQFCRTHVKELQFEQTRIHQLHGLSYPLMKLTDMFFHQIGFELDAEKEKLKAASAQKLTAV